jgi:glycosyltransferase-like protein
VSGPRVAMLTYSSKPRGGVAHALHLAEALHRIRTDVHLYALGDPAEGFYRPARVPHTLFPVPSGEGTLEERVRRAVEAMRQGLLEVAGRHDVFHAQDCIAARAALDLRDEVEVGAIVRTVHHIDDFTTPFLVDCQHRSVVLPDRVLVVSEHWRRLLANGYGVEPTVVPSGVDLDRFRRPPTVDPLSLRERAGAADRFLFLTVGGIEPRKGSLEMVEALARLRDGDASGPMLAVVGGHSFQDHSAYRDRVFARMREIGVEEGRDVVVLGTVDDGELEAWYRAADAFVFPSVKEGFGLVVLEAMAAGLPVVATDIPVFREYLTDDDAVLAPAGSSQALAEAMERLMRDPELRDRLGEAGPELAARFSWERSARSHREIYEELPPRPAEAPLPSRSGNRKAIF